MATFAQGLQLRETSLPIGGVSGGQDGALEQRAHLIAEAAFVGVGAEPAFQTVEPTIAAQRQGERLPGTIVGPSDSLRQTVAVIDKTILDELDDALGGQV